MKVTSLIVTLLAGSALFIPAAQAADMDIIPAPVEEAYVPVEVGNGWYLRGDISYDMSTNASGSYRTFDGTTYSTVAYDRFDFAATKDFAFGVGYQYNSFLRGDLTGGYWRRNVSGTDTDPGRCTVAAPVGSTCRSTDSSSVSGIELMANAYADLGTFVGVTPYVGAGAGVTFLNFDTLTNASHCIDAAGVVIGGCGTTATHPGEKSMRFTWALMAGASYDISKNLKFDLGYRYARVAGGSMFGFDSATAGIGATGVQGTHKAFSSHQIKAGLRYSLW